MINLYPHYLGNVFLNIPLSAPWIMGFSTLSDGIANSSRVFVISVYCSFWVVLSTASESFLTCRRLAGSTSGPGEHSIHNALYSLGCGWENLITVGLPWLPALCPQLKKMAGLHWFLSFCTAAWNTMKAGGWRDCSVLFSHSVGCNSLWPHESQQARPPCPTPIPGVHSNSCPSS